MDHKVLITGGSGLIGTRLTEMLLQKGYQVVHLSRNRGGSVPTFTWDVDHGKIEKRALDSVSTVIHLAGEPVGAHRWTKKQKQKILSSRTKSAQLLFQTLNTHPHHVSTFISASGIDYYDFNSGEKFFYEDSPRGDSFLADVVKQWEQEADQIARLDVRVAKLRTGIVLSAQGGALMEMLKPIRWFVGAPLGSGKQIMNWIHIDDLCRIFIHAIENNLAGVYNAVAPNPVSNKEFTKALARIVNKPLLLPPVPSFILKWIVGEMAKIIVSGEIVSAEKILKTGFRFQFTEVEGALRNLLN